MEPDPVDVLLGAVKIYSPPGGEGRLADYLKGTMQELGYRRVSADDAGNVIGEAGGSGPRVLLCGHMDTVPGELPVSLAGGTLRGRGASDAKAPLCALMIAGAAASGVRVTFAAVTREEDDSLGIRTLAKSGRSFDYAVFGEPSGSTKVAVGYRGSVVMKASLATQGGHAGGAWAHKSAIDGYLRVLGRLREYEAEKTVKGDHFRSLSVTPTLLRAGSAHNVVPATCEGTFDVRIPPGTSGADVVKELAAIVADAGDGVKSVATFDEVTEPYEVDPGSVVLRAFRRAILLTLKTKPVMVKKTGTGDMNTLGASSGTDCITYGPGSSETSHSDREMVGVEDYRAAIRVVKEALGQVGGLSKAT